MARGFITGNRNQPYLMPPSLNDWLPDDHPARFIHDTVRLMNLDCFYKEYSHEGSPPFEPGMMLCVLVYAYSKGMRSSRKIARACEDEVPFRWLTGNVFPNHSAICRFRTRHKENFKES